MKRNKGRNFDEAGASEISRSKISELVCPGKTKVASRFYVKAFACLSIARLGENSA